MNRPQTFKFGDRVIKLAIADTSTNRIEVLRGTVVRPTTKETVYVLWDGKRQRSTPYAPHELVLADKQSRRLQRLTRILKNNMRRHVEGLSGRGTPETLEILDLFGSILPGRMPIGVWTRHKREVEQRWADDGMPNVTLVRDRRIIGHRRYRRGSR